MLLRDLLCLVVVRDLNVIGIAISPNETDSELVINPNAVLTFPIPFQFFQAIAWRHSQIVQCRGAVEHEKSS
jgi:hypothetical protein